MCRTLSAVVKALRGWRACRSVDDDQTEPPTLYVTPDGKSLALSVPLLEGQSVTVMPDGSTIAPEGTAQTVIEAALSKARRSLALAKVEPWF